MLVYKPYKKTASGKEEVKIPYNVLSNPPDLSVYAKLAGNNTFTGGQTITGDNNGYSINASGYVKGSWLQAPSTGKASSNTGKVCVLDGSGWVYYRTPAEIVSDGGGATAPHLYEHNIYLDCSNTTSTVAPSRVNVYFTVITTNATAWTWNNLISPNYFAGTGTSLNAGGYGYLGDLEGNNKSFNASVQKISFGSNFIQVTMVYNNSLLGIDNTYDTVVFYSNGVTITDKVRTIL